MINMTKIDYVINITGASYDIVRKALLDSDGDVDVAISYIREGKYDVNIELQRFMKMRKKKNLTLTEKENLAKAMLTM